jgi:hypothetical protein
MCLILLIGLSTFFIKFDPKIDTAYFFLFLLEAIICFYYQSRNKIIYKLILLDFVFFIFTQNILPFIIQLDSIDYNIRLKVFEYSSTYYNFIMLYRVITVHAVALGYLTFGKITSISKILYTTFLIFAASSLLIYFFEISFDSIIMFSSFFGVFNHLFYMVLSKKERIHLEFKKDLLFLFYFLGFSLGLLEYIPVFGNSDQHISTSYNYVMYLLIALIIIVSPEKKLYHLIHNTTFKVIMIIFTITLSFADYHPQIYYLQRIFLLSVLSIFLFLSEDRKYLLRKVKS